MNNWEQISSIVDRALDLNPNERLAFVEDICADDQLLKANVIHFLDNIQPSENLWEKMVESSSVLVNEITSSDVDIDNTQLFSPLKQAGPYRVIELIARGGMGNVYLAERSDGQFERTVAIKILRHELSLKNHVERFRLNAISSQDSSILT
jgi:eukaryotic-like serine/threonine-protein kinase